jgi:Ca2+-binding EF-hand superfamily protein
LLVYFDLFDTDGDGKINRNDLKYFLESLVDEVDQNTITIGENNKNDFIMFKENINEMVERIMKEVLITSEQECILFRDFTDLMYDSNIDRTCVIDFDEV